MFRSAAPWKVLRKMTNITVAMTAAAAVNSRAANLKMRIGSERMKIRLALCDHLGFFENSKGAMKMHRKDKQIPTRKHANIQVLAVLTMSRIDTTSVGRAILAPAKSSLVIISTGLNQYAV